MAFVGCATADRQQPLTPASYLADNPNATSAVPLRREFPVNPQIRPCQDFYRYACSKVQGDFKLRPDRSRHMFAFDDSSERLLEAKKQFFFDLAENRLELSPRGQQLKPFYKSCMNTVARAEEERQLVERTLRELKSLKTRGEFQAWFIGRTLSGEAGVISFGESANQDDPDVKDIAIMANWALATLPERSYYSRPEVMNDFRLLATEFFSRLGLDQPEVRAEGLMAFEKGHMEKQPLPREMRVLWNERNEVARSKLLKDYPHLGLGEVFKKIPSQTKVRFVTPDNFKYLDEYLSTAPMDELQSLAAYLALSGRMDEAYPEYMEKKVAFGFKHLGGPEKRPSLQERCTRDLMGRFNKEVDAELVERLFPNFPQEKFVELLLKAKGALAEGLNKNEWLSPEGKSRAIEKIEKARFQVVKPGREKDWDFNPVRKYSEGSFVHNTQILAKAKMEKMLKELPERRNKDEWGMGPLTVNAYYSSQDNKFVMPLGILQYPFYSPELPDHVNLGAVGAVVGHELGHGIDDQGSKYDVNGRLKQWLLDSDVREFKRRGEMLIEQFNRAGHDGKLTLGENIGDFVGLSFAYQAAFPDNQGSQKEKQDFFLQYARVWCGVMRPKEVERRLKTGPHSLIYARVNEQVKQQPAFKEAYQCRDGDPMTLPAKDLVKIW